MIPHHFAADLGNLTLKAAYAGLTGIVANQVTKRLLRHVEFVLAQTIGLDLLGQQILQRNVDLLVLGVPGDTNNLHAVQQRRRNVHGVRRAHEHHVGEIVIDLPVMVVEGVILFRVEHFQQR